jgi:hypothetical protein
MKTRHVDGTDAKRVLAGMIQNTAVCSRIASQWKDDDGGLFAANTENLVASWCIRHVRKYGKAPGEKILTIFERWSDKHDGEPELIDSVARGLNETNRMYISEKWEQDSTEYLLDVSRDLFDSVRLERECSDIKEALEAHDVARARKIRSDSRMVEMGLGSMCKPPLEYEPWAAAFSKNQDDSLIFYPDGLGKFFGKSLCRDSLVAFMGPDKSGKSYLLIDAAFRAIRTRRRVAYFEAGDLMESGVLYRLGQRATRRPARAGTVRFPIGYDNETKKPITEDRTFNEDLSSSVAYKAFRRICREGDLFRLSCHANSTLTVAGVSGLLKSWEQTDGWRADVIILDYSDILAPPFGMKESNEQIDENWKQLRRLSQETHTLVLTATQSNAAAYTGKDTTLSRKHFSGRKTKLAHCNAMVGINCTDADKEKGVARLNWVVRRDASFSSRKVATIIGCLKVASPAVLSFF